MFLKKVVKEKTWSEKNSQWTVTI